MRLGEPDAVAQDESWISYGSAYRGGGALFVIFAGGSGAGAGSMGMHYRRLIVPFDAHGFVTEPIFEKTDCVEHLVFMHNAGGGSQPCLDIYGHDIPEKYKLREVRP